jgi:serine/threonine protein kinase
MSLENLLVHESGALIIDMGMCLRVPFVVSEEDVVDGAIVVATVSNNYSNNNPAGHAAAIALAASMQNMNVNGGMIMPLHSTVSKQSAAAASSSSSAMVGDEIELHGRSRRRCLIRPQGTCGKWIYMSPEIYKDSEPFDGYAVDVWAAGVILFLMLTGFPPWERACQTDERFKYMTAGYLVQMLTEWDLGLTSDALDLLQRMLFLDPKDCLSLDQV